jgi:pimeloyl-ACP methyl ester carboxylesterase
MNPSTSSSVRLHTTKVTNSFALSTVPLSTRQASTVSITSNNDNSHQSFELPSKRIISYATYGPQNGKPLVFLHGFPSSRLECWPVAPLAARLNIRIIAPDRPGFGGSTFYPNSIADAAEDVGALVRHLGFTKVPILGGSGGGPFALACALKSETSSQKAEFVSKLGLMAAAPPWIDEKGNRLDGLPLISRFFRFATLWTPWLVSAVTVIAVSFLKRFCSSKWARSKLEGWVESMENRKKEKKKHGTQDDGEPANELTVPEKGDQILKIFFETFAQGPRAMVHECKLLFGDWGFKFEDVEAEKILMWHGTKDTRAPISLARYMAKRLRNCTFREYSDDGHFSLARHLEDILKEMTSEENSQTQDQEA